MAVKFANRMNLLKGSEIRALLALTAKPEVISFAGGMPAPELFPTEGVKEAACKVMDNMGRVALQYTGTDGFASLREKIVARMAAKNDIHVSIDDILITSGSQQGLDFSARVFLNPGDVVLVESPSYLGAINAFKACEPTFVEVPTDDAGMIPEELDKILATTENVKMIYVIPDFQNPTGLSYSKEVHDRVVEIFKGTDIVVLEDNPYRELRFSGTATDSFGKELGEQCCMLGTFSKIVAPGMRIGWVCVRNKALREKLLSYKATADLHTNIFSQLVLAQYLADNDIDAHIEKTKVLYKHKAELMMDCMRKYLPEGVEFTPTEGGMFLWAKLPNGMSAVDLYRVALARGVAICPGDPFYEKERNVSTFRINYSNSSDEVIEKGIRILGEACAELIAKKGN